MSSRTRLPHPRSQAGFTIIEVMVAAMLLLVGMLGVLAMVDRAGQSTMQSSMREGGMNLARQIAEQSRTIPYPQLNQAALRTRLQAIPGLEGTSQDPWVIRHRNTDYTVTTNVCAVDDAADGKGNQTGGGFCDGQTAGNLDATPNDYKRVTIAAAYRDGARTRTVSHTTLISTAGAADAPAVTALRPTSAVAGTPGQPMITSSSTTSVTFEAEATANATKVFWSVDGVERAQATAVGGKWTFTLDLNSPQLLDGTYEIGAYAVDAVGAEGSTFTIPLRLIRGPAAAPAPIYASANTVMDGGVEREVAELDWIENKARNVVGYKVYRGSTTTGTPICPTPADKLVTKPGCLDTQTTWGTYTVTALYLDSANRLQQSAGTTVGPVAPPGPGPQFLTQTPVNSPVTNCSTGGALLMQPDTPGAVGSRAVSNPSSLLFCSVAATEALRFASQDVTAKLVLQNSHGNKDCTVTAKLAANNGTLMPTAGVSRTVQNGQRQQLSFPLTLPATTFAVGTRVNLSFAFSGPGCSLSTVHFGGLDTAASVLELPGGAVPPLPPTNLQAAVGPTGGVRVTWNPPATGKTPAFYRLYRGTKDFRDRIDRTGNDTTYTLTDTERTFGAGTKYYVTAVGDVTNPGNLAESPAVEVTG